MVKALLPASGTEANGSVTVEEAAANADNFSVLFAAAWMVHGTTVTAIAARLSIMAIAAACQGSRCGSVGGPHLHCQPGICCSISKLC